MSQGDSAAACRLQDQKDVNGVACDRLPKFVSGPRYCEAHQPIKRTAAEQVVGVVVTRESGSAKILNRDTGEKFSATLRLKLLEGKWRVTALTWPRHRLRPAGLANEGPNPIREKLWPVC
jgi:hypothetical protein